MQTAVTLKTTGVSLALLVGIATRRRGWLGRARDQPRSCAGALASVPARAAVAGPACGRGRRFANSWRRADGAARSSDSRARGPLRPVFLRRHPVFGRQMPLQNLQLLAVFEADDVIVAHRATDRYRRASAPPTLSAVRRQPSERVEDRLNQPTQLRACDGVVADMRRDDLGSQGEKLAAIDTLVAAICVLQVHPSNKARMACSQAG